VSKCQGESVKMGDSGTPCGPQSFKNQARGCIQEGDKIRKCQ